MTAQERADAWNARWPVGTAIDLQKVNGEVHRGKTIGPAYVQNDDDYVPFTLDGTMVASTRFMTPIPTVIASTPTVYNIKGETVR